MSVTPELQNEPPLYTIKILLLGESSVGKSSIVNRYTNHTFQSNGLLTIGIEVKKIIKQVHGKKIRLERNSASLFSLGHSRTRKISNPAFTILSWHSGYSPSLRHHQQQFIHSHRRVVQKDR